MSGYLVDILCTRTALADGQLVGSRGMAIRTRYCSLPVLATALALLLGGCTTSPAGSVPAASSAPSGPLGPPPPTPAPFRGCRPLAGTDLKVPAGVSWRTGSAEAKRLGCHVTLSTSPTGGTLELDFQASSTAQADVQARLREARSLSRNGSAVALPDLGVGTSSGGVAFVRGEAASYLLYASTKTTLVAVVCSLPASVVKQSADTATLTATAHALLVWAVLHQPSQH